MISRFRTGFTLVEMVAAVTIFAIIAAGIGSSLFSGLKIWARANDAGRAKLDYLLGIESISGELRQAVNSPSVGFEGGKSDFSFPLIVDDFIMKIAYSFGADGKLTRTASNLKDLLGEDKESGRVKDVMALKGLSFGYLGFDQQKTVYVWKDEWKKDDGIPRAVRLQGVFEEEEFVKTVFIPAS